MSLRATQIRWALGSAGLFALAALSLLVVILLLQRQRSLDEGGQRLLQSQQRVADGLDQVFARAELRAAEVGSMARSGALSGPQILQVFAAKLLHDGELVQFGLLLEPDNPVSKDSRFAVGVTFGANGVRIEDFVATRFEYWTKSWYLKTRESVSGWWSAPYFNDAAGGQDTLTFDFPLRDQNGVFFGMTSVSLSMERVVEMAHVLGWNEHSELSDFVLIDSNQRILTSAQPNVQRTHTLDSAERQNSTPLLRWLREAPDRQQRQLIHAEASGLSLVRLPLTRVDWQLAAAVSDDRLLGPLYRNGLIAALAVLSIAALLGLWVARRAARFAQPIVHLSSAAERLAQGELDRPITPPPADSMLRPLGEALEHGRQALSQYVGRAREQHDAQQRSQGQAELSRQLQASALPADRVFIGAQYQAQINAELRPTPCLAEDFYGFVTPGPGICAFYLGSVQGREADAVALLTRLTALLPLALRLHDAAPKALQWLAEQLQPARQRDCRIHLQLGRLDLNDGRLSLCNAQMPSPILLRGQAQETVDVPPSPALCSEAIEASPARSIQLAPGDRLLLYSDGMLSTTPNEPIATAQTRLQVAIEKQIDSPPDLLLHNVLDEVTQGSKCEHPHDLSLMMVAMGFRD